MNGPSVMPPDPFRVDEDTEPPTGLRLVSHAIALVLIVGALAIVLSVCAAVVAACFRVIF